MGDGGGKVRGRDGVEGEKRKAEEVEGRWQEK